MSLSSADIAHLEAVLAQGKKPKVVFTDAAGQVAGRTGKVVALDPAGVDDFVQVAFGSDELSFSAVELRLPAPGEGARRTAPRQRAAAPTGPGLLPDDAPETKAPEPKLAPKPVVSERKTVTEPAPSAPEPVVKKKAARPRAQAAKHPELTVTLTYEDGEWSVAATRGARTVVKGAKVAHTNALTMCQASGSDEVNEVVSEVVEKIRSEAAEEAARLRRQLEEAEARLAELK